MKYKLLMLIICFIMTMVTFGQENPFAYGSNWIKENNKPPVPPVPPGPHRPGHNHPTPVGTSTLLLLGLATGSIIYKTSKKK